MDDELFEKLYFTLPWNLSAEERVIQRELNKKLLPLSLELLRKELSKTSDAAKSVDVDKRGS